MSPSGRSQIQGSFVVVFFCLLSRELRAEPFKNYWVLFQMNSDAATPHVNTF